MKVWLLIGSIACTIAFCTVRIALHRPLPALTAHVDAEIREDPMGGVHQMGSQITTVTGTRDHATSNEDAPQSDKVGRRIPHLVLLSELFDPGLATKAVPIPEANTSFHLNYEKGHFGRVLLRNGEVRLFNPEMILVKFAGASLVSVLHVEPGREVDAVRKVSAREDVEFAELDMVQQRAGAVNDPLVGSQWHHASIHSFQAWDYGIAQSPVRVAIVDTPFQMDHPDLASNTVTGWDVVTGLPVDSSAGIVHSTLCAGLVSAVVNNGVGVAGVANCMVLPISITAATSEMCDAVYWAASNNVRVVNISWTGADSDALNAAGNFLKVHARGLLVMPGGNGAGELDFPNQPDIWCVSMTDAANNPRSKYGAAIDFAAPGWAIYSTSIGGGYATDSGTSYSAPIFAAVCARLFAINPLLGPEDVIDILKNTSVDLGSPGWDMWFGWGKIDFGAAAAVAYSRLPRMTVSAHGDLGFTLGTGCPPGTGFELFQSVAPVGAPWTKVENIVIGTNAGQLTIANIYPAGENGYYRILVK